MTGGAVGDERAAIADAGGGDERAVVATRVAGAS